MRINVLQHTPNEGPGTIQEWSQDRGHEMYIYHPYQFGNLPTADETDMLIILGGPMSPNDDLTWIKQERVLIQRLLDIPPKLTALHWHEEMFEVPAQADLLFSSDLVKNQGFVMNGNVIGLQFHFEPTADNVREIAVNDDQYPLDHNDLHQNGKEIIQHGVPAENKRVMYRLLDFIANS